MTLRTGHKDPKLHPSVNAILALRARAIDSIPECFYSEQQRRAWTAEIGTTRVAFLRSDPDTVWALKYAGERLIGTAWCEIIARPHITGMFVDPLVQGRGIGAELLHMLLRSLKTRNVGMVSVTASTNARAFYAKEGFESDREVTWNAKSPLGPVEIPAVLMHHKFLQDSHVTGSNR